MIHKILYVFSVPLIDFEEFMIRVKDMPRMIFQTKKALVNDDWDKLYKDNFISSSPIWPFSPECGFNPEIIILGYLIPKSLIKLLYKQYNLNQEQQITFIKDKTKNNLVERGLIEKIFGGVGKTGSLETSP